jgi:hypothetical protein
MTRYEAYIEKNWMETGLAHLLVARIRENGATDFAIFLVDLFCLGVKDVVLENDVAESELRELVAERLPDDFREPVAPACAKKMIEGALAYAEKLGFAPHANFRKARKVLSGLDASRCPQEFTYGRAMCADWTTPRNASTGCWRCSPPAVAPTASTSKIPTTMTI